MTLITVTEQSWHSLCQEMTELRERDAHIQAAIDKLSTLVERRRKEAREARDPVIGASLTGEVAGLEVALGLLKRQST